jgi:signal transduction histidine kinase
MSTNPRESSTDVLGRSRKIGAAATLIMALASLAIVWAAELEEWRIAVLAGAFAIALAVAASFVTAPGRALTWVASIASLAAHAAACAVTGGLESPLLPVLPAIVASPLLDTASARERGLYLATVAALVTALAVLPEEVRRVALDSPWRALLALVSIAWAVLIVRETAKRIVDAQNRAARAMDRLRDERVQEALAQARRLQSVGAKVAHELKNPLAAIKGLVQLVGRGVTDDRNVERIAVLRGEIDRMEIILSEYLSYSRPLEDLEPAPVRLSTVVADVVAVLSARAENGGVRLDCSGDAPAVEADRRRLKEALINLVSNALQATPRGGRVTIAVAPADGGASLEVIDTGAGISEADMTRLGQSYFTTREGGTGLGFVLAKSAIAQHGGTLEVSSKVGTGTTIRVFLPDKQPKREEMPSHG